MIRLLLAMFFAASGTLAGVKFGSVKREAEIQRATNAAVTGNPKNSVYLAPEIFTSAVIRGKDQPGFAIFRFALETDLAVKNQTGIGDEVILADALNSVALNNELYTASKDGTPDISAFADQMVAISNRATGGKRFKRALILQFDLFSRTEVRKRVVEERMLSEDVPKTKPKVAEH